MDVVGVEQGIRKLQPQVRIFPRRPKLPGARQEKLVRAVHPNQIAFAGNTHGCSETPIFCDHVIRQDAAIASSADAELVGVGNTACHDMIDGGKKVFNFQVTPVRDNRLGKIIATATAAAIIDAEHDVALRGEHLPLELPQIVTQIVLILAARPAVYPHHGGILFSLLIIRRLDHQAMNFGPVPAVELQLLDRPKADLGHQHIVVPRELAQPLCVERIQFVRRMIVRVQHGRMAGAGADAIDDRGCAVKALDCTGLKIEARRIFRHVIFDADEDRARVLKRVGRDRAI